MKLSLKIPITDIDGSESKDTLAKVLAQLIKSSPTGDALKYLDWALTLWRTGDLDGLTLNDFDELKGVVERSQAWAMVRGQIMREMIKQRDAQAAKQQHSGNHDEHD